MALIAIVTPIDVREGMGGMNRNGEAIELRHVWLS